MDPNKAAANVRKRGVQFSEAPSVFSDDYAITINDNESYPDGQRIISARATGRPERDQYEAQRCRIRTISARVGGAES